MINAKMVKILGIVATAKRKWKRKSMNALTKSSPHLMTKRKSPNRGSFSLLDKLSCAIRKRLFRLSRNM